MAFTAGEDAWKAIDIAEVMKKAGSAVPPEMQQAAKAAIPCHFPLSNALLRFASLHQVVDQMLWRRQKSQANDNRWDHLPKAWPQ